MARQFTSGAETQASGVAGSTASIPTDGIIQAGITNYSFDTTTFRSGLASFKFNAATPHGARRFAISPAVTLGSPVYERWYFNWATWPSALDACPNRTCSTADIYPPENGKY